MVTSLSGLPGVRSYRGDVIALDLGRLSRQHTLTAADAAREFRQVFPQRGGASTFLVKEPRLVIDAPIAGKSPPPRLAWEMVVRPDATATSATRVVADAHTGKILSKAHHCGPECGRDDGLRHHTWSPRADDSCVP